jgi:alkylated DNA repair dioxygenase AlkB
MDEPQLGFFEEAPRLPEGFRYQPDLIEPDEERRLIDQIQTLPFREFEFHGYKGKRRVVSFGWRYDFAKSAVFRADDIPDFLIALRETAAEFGDLAPTELQQVLVSEYQEAAGIGWHRDKAVFGDVIGVSLLSACDFRMRRKQGKTWDRVTIAAQPRSAYLLRGPSRTEWEHSIPGVDALRYSITFRNLRG